MSENSIANLAAALVKAQAEIAGATKNATNPAFRSKYADLAAVMEAIKPALAKHGLGFVQEITERDEGVYVETVIVHQSGEVYRCGKLPMPAPKRDPHGYGSAISYAKRYSLMAAFGVPAEDDDGNAAAAARPEKPEPKAADPLESPEAKAMLARLREAALEGEEALQAAFQKEPKGAIKNAVWKAHSASLKEAASQVSA